MGVFALGMGHSLKCLVMTLISSSSLDMDQILCTYNYWLSGRSGQENIWLEVRTGTSAVRSMHPDLEPNIWPDSVNKHFIMWPLFFALHCFCGTVCISSRAICVFPALSPQHVRPSYGNFFLMVFQGNCARGHTGPMINVIIGKLLKESIMCASLSI